MIKLNDHQLCDLADHLDKVSTAFKTAQRQRHRRRAHLRAENHLRARCARCEADMLMFSPDDALTQEACDFFRGEYRPEDILCFWCWNDFGADDERGRAQAFR